MALFLELLIGLFNIFIHLNSVNSESLVAVTWSQNGFQQAAEQGELKCSLFCSFIIGLLRICGHEFGIDLTLVLGDSALSSKEAIWG
uniref:Secreted protein n=1 Tax=Syphacia muris TaxID=451379 RepID=A0A0N5AHT0_9BILA